MTTTTSTTPPPRTTSAPWTAGTVPTPRWVPALLGPRWQAPVVFAAVLATFLLITPVRLPLVPVPLADGTTLELMYTVGGWAGEFSAHSAWDFTSWVVPLTWAGSLSAVAGVLVSRRHTVAATVLGLAPFLLIPLLGVFVWGWWLGLLMITVLAILDGVRRALIPLAATVAMVPAYTCTGIAASTPVGQVMAGAYDGSLDRALSATVLYLVATVAVVTIGAAVGASVRARRRSEVAAQVEQHALEVESVASERARLAHDLHDVVAHHVSLVAVRAESAPYVHPGLDDDARGVLALIATDARRALDELRQVLTVLQRTERDGDRAPQPGACEIVALIDQAQAAGHDVLLDGACDDVPAAQGYVLYRATQEALTNARRHAPGATTRVTLSRTDDAVGVEVRNAVGTADTRDLLPGRGLTGMRERVESLGGTVAVDSEDGEFVVSVVLPAGRTAAR